MEQKLGSIILKERIEKLEQIISASANKNPDKPTSNK
jgi:hypothetical protein